MLPLLLPPLYFDSTHEGAMMVRAIISFLFPLERQLQPSVSFDTLTLSSTPFCLSFVLPLILSLNPLSQQSLLGESSRYACPIFQNDHML